MKKESVSTLFALIFGIVAYFLIASVPVLIFAPDRLRGEIGLLAGVALAIASLVHMNAVLVRSTYMEKNQSAFITANSVGRMLVILGVLVVTAMTGWADFVTMLIGLFGEKVSALANPYIIKVLTKIIKKRR